MHTAKEMHGIAGGNAHWYNVSGKEFDNIQQNYMPFDSPIPLLGIYPKYLSLTI